MKIRMGIPQLKAKLKVLVKETEITIETILNSNDISLNELGATENFLEELKIAQCNFKKSV